MDVTIFLGGRGLKVSMEIFSFGGGGGGGGKKERKGKEGRDVSVSVQHT